MILFIRNYLSIVSSILLVFTVRSISASNLTSPIDYGFGPLWLVYANGDLSRCNNISFSFGGGFAPYGLGERVAM